MANRNPFLVDIGQGLSMMIGLPKIPSWKTVRRPKKAKPGTVGFNTQTNNLEYFDGSSWWGASMSEG